ncbi:hypothetical protein BDV93DRAFT_519960 [Ceratobasidium sp. AG-I]|nr:hypothetical protein BDV93DRAFT_519960 [Ceratobasidium sp. AG-I]
MSRTPLLPDLIRSVAEYLRGDNHSLISLCLADKRSLGLVTPLIYKEVYLFTTQSIRQFCNVIRQSKRNLGIYPALIWFSPEDPSDGQLYRLVDSIRHTLCHTPNLKNLVLDIDILNLSNLYRHLHVHPPPFSLRSLECYFTPKHFVSFLSTQPSIRNLVIQTTDRSGLFHLRTAPRDSILPHLQRIEANIFTINALLPGRPIACVETDTMVLRSATARLFCESLRRSSAPGGVKSISVQITTTELWTSASDFITHLVGVCGESLIALRIVMPGLPVEPEFLDEYTLSAEIVAGSLRGFSKLRYFSFDGEDYPPRRSDAIGLLGIAGTLAFWVEQCTSLRRVSLFRVDLS